MLDFMGFFLQKDALLALQELDVVYMPAIVGLSFSLIAGVVGYGT